MDDEDNVPSGSSSGSNKKTRGPTVCKKLKKRIENQNLECQINFDEYGQPCGDMLKDFTIYLGSVVRFQVDINLESWDVVNQGLKDVIWDDIKNRWKLDDSRKKIVLEKAAKQWRDFKGKLTKNFLRTGKDPCEVYHFISREQWEIYKTRRQSEEFKAISDKAKKSQQHNEHVHFLGPSGYRAKRTKWSIEDPIAGLENSESLDPSILSSDRSVRSYDWVRARTKKNDKGEYYIPNSQTKEVFEKMGELQKQVVDGSWTPKGHDDILSRALGRKEHGGRVRGVGGGAKIKDVFGPGKSKQSGVISMDELATITQEITKKVQKECDEKLEIMNTKLQGMFHHLKQIGLSLPEDNFLDDIGNPRQDIVRSSCQSVGEQDHISELKTPTLCRLCVIDMVKGRVVVARGTVFPSNNEGGNLIHNNPIAPQNIRVSVDDVVPEFQQAPLPVPCNEHETIGNAEGSFVQWPKDLVMLGQDPISLENKKGHDKRSKDVVTKPESKGSATQKNKGLGDENSTQNCRSLRYLLEQSNAKGTTFTFEQDGEPIYVTYEDVDQFLKRSWLNIPILEIFSKYIGKLCKELNDDRFAFMSPSRLVINHKREYNRIEDATQYMTQFLVANKDKRFIIAPYIQDDHWMLLLFCLDESVIYVFDSLRRERDIRLTTPARTAFKLYVPQGGKRNNRKEFLWSHTDVQCPQQEGGTECGFFVMRYMYEVVKLSQKNPNINWKEGLGLRRYLKKEINEVRELWAEYFTVECL
ncbi:hypothetical protein DCAR_0934608 [Daucus carota subsp. sativus]|uniref:Ubiquitin-like protease family profile domain-containing protein n=1 Tax=Daucus carota subsp. sativus TaxID=79200 RepID=A0AAF0XVJ3_DAUCS|nr:hypothetical protein DCAR_0934608 [Daucus carota subsp. sativus]